MNEDDGWYARELGLEDPMVDGHISEHSSNGLGGETIDNGEKSVSE